MVIRHSAKPFNLHHDSPVTLISYSTFYVFNNNYPDIGLREIQDQFNNQFSVVQYAVFPSHDVSP